MAKREDIANLIYALKQMGISEGDFVAHNEGVLFKSLDLAQKFVANHADKYELGARIDGKVSGWLVKPKAAD